MSDMRNRIGVIILAAGLGTRMKSNKAKVLHELMDRPMVLYVVDVAASLAGRDVVVVTGHQSEQVRQIVSASFDVRFALQSEQLGTGHAVQCALPELDAEIEQVVILCGDVPLLSLGTLDLLIVTHREREHDITVLAVNVDDPTGYGRMIVNSEDRLLKIVEEADATTAEKQIKSINSGIYCVDRRFLDTAVRRLKPNNVQKELYLTDIIQIGNDMGKKVGVVVGPDADEVVGINSREDLARAEGLLWKSRGKIS